MPRAKNRESKNVQASRADDLTAIQGIGQARKRWLKESLQIDTYEHLAAQSPSELEARLKSEGQTVSRAAIEAWIAGAHELAAASSSRPAEGLGASREERAESASDRNWRPFASFVVEFQRLENEGDINGGQLPTHYRTAIHHVEADDNDAWLGIDLGQLSQWMLKRAEYGEHEKSTEDFEAERREPVSPIPPSAPVGATVDITAIRLFQGSETRTPQGISVSGRPFSGTVKGNEPFSPEVSLELRGERASETASGGRKYRVQLYAENLATATRMYLGDAAPVAVIAEGGPCTAALPETVLPSGMYRLSILARREGDGLAPERLEEPLLRVV